MPTNRQRIMAVITSAGIAVAGAWIASQVPLPDTGATRARAAHANLVVILKGVRNANGNLVVMVFDERDAFKNYDYDKAVEYKRVTAATGDNLIAFPDLKKGPYAIAAFHDENENEVLDRGGQLPTEGYATSGASDAYDEPSFKRASVPPGEVTVQMHYLNQ